MILPREKEFTDIFIDPLADVNGEHRIDNHELIGSVLAAEMSFTPEAAAAAIQVAVSRATRFSDLIKITDFVINRTGSKLNLPQEVRDDIAKIHDVLTAFKKELNNSSQTFRDIFGTARSRPFNLEAKFPEIRTRLTEIFNEVTTEQSAPTTDAFGFYERALTPLSTNFREPQYAANELASPDFLDHYAVERMLALLLVSQNKSLAQPA